MSRFDDMLAAANQPARKHMGHEEDKLQMSCRTWFDYAYPKQSLLLHHSPNEGLLKNSARDGAKRKAMGMRPGFPDFILLLPHAGKPYLCIELKTKKGRQSEAQRIYQQHVEACGGAYEIVRSLDEFMTLVNEWMGK